MSKIIIERLSAKGLFKVGTLYGHKNQIIQIQAHLSLDLIVSVDRTGYVMVHELTDLRFMRSFQLNLDLNSKANGHILHLRLH